MNPSDVDTSELIRRLEDKSNAINMAVSYIKAVRGAAHFRESIELLLVGSPDEKPQGEDFEGLYGRARNAILRGRS